MVEPSSKPGEAPLPQLDPDGKFRHRADTSRFPLVIIPTIGGHPMDKVDRESLFSEMQRVLDMRQPHVTLQDIRGARVDATRRKRMAAWITTNEDTLARYLKAYALLMDSEMQRHIVTAISWFITKPPCPFKVFTDQDEAEAWLLSQL